MRGLIYFGVVFFLFFLAAELLQLRRTEEVGWEKVDLQEVVADLLMPGIKGTISSTDRRPLL